LALGSYAAIVVNGLYSADVPLRNCSLNLQLTTYTYKNNDITVVQGSCAYCLTQLLLAAFGLNAL